MGKLNGVDGNGGGVREEVGDAMKCAGGGDEGDAYAGMGGELARELDEGINMTEGEKRIHDEVELGVRFKRRHFVEHLATTWWDGISTGRTSCVVGYIYIYIHTQCTHYDRWIINMVG